MNKKPRILLRNSFKDRGQITLLDKKAAEDSQDLTAAPATETPRKKLDAGEEAHAFRIPRCKRLAMLMFFCAYLQAACIFTHCCWPHAVEFNVLPCVVQCCLSFVFGCLLVCAVICELGASYCDADSHADVYVRKLPGSHQTGSSSAVFKEQRLV